ncbi:MAG: prolyl oligopeptidase family serine peptidase [Fimbriimonadaceae bacterium]
MRSMRIFAMLAVCLTAYGFAETGLELATSRETDLKFDELFPRRSHFGSNPRVLGWSHNDRYLAYTWNQWGVIGNDLWFYDSKSGKSSRMTTPQTFLQFDGDIPDAIKQYDESQKRWDEWEKLSDEDFRQSQEDFQEQQKKDKTPRKNYGGPSELEWARNKDEFLMTYRGDIYRWKVGDKAPVRLTDTTDVETNVEYLPDDQGFVFRRGSAVYRMRFDGPSVVQLSPTLDGGKTFGGYSISPDGSRMLVYANKNVPGTRQVDWISYRGRFATAQKTERGVADDDFLGETYIYLYDIRESTILDKSKKNEPFEIWKWAGGEEWEQSSISNKPWSKDGKRFVFGTWARDKKELKINEANVDDRKVNVIYSGTSDGEHSDPGMADPFYAGDDTSVVVMLSKSGWRHLHLLDGKGGERQVTSGNFDVLPQQLAADGKGVLVQSSKEELARIDFYRVNLDSGIMDRLSRLDGNRSAATFAHKSDQYATVFSSWSQMRELYVNDGKSEVKQTDSHRSEQFWSTIKEKAELFTFNNRHGDKIHCYQMVPKDMKPGEKRPLFIYVYGGPLGTGHSVTDGAFNSTAYMFAQYLTHTLGYITVTIDPRGQSDYGSAFGKANWDNPGANQTEDIVDLVKYYDAKGMVDRTRVGLNGWSFGGFQTQHAMYNAPDYITLGIAGAGPTEWQNYNTWYSGGVIGNAPKGKVEEIDKFSLTRSAKNLKSPLMLLHGMEDTNVLFQDTVHVYQSLLKAGKGPLVELCLDPTGGHGMGGDVNTRDRHAIYLAFILKHWEAGRQTKPAPMP